MFWGLVLKANRKYTQKVKKSFHVSQAALDIVNCTDEPVQVLLTADNNTFLLCTLRKNKVEQVTLDLNFAEGNEISFTSQGNGNVHLSGYLIPESDEDLDFLGDEESENEELETKTSKKIKPEKPSKPAAKAKQAVKRKVADEEAEEDDEDNEDGSSLDSDEEADVGMGEEEDDDDEDEDDEEAEEEDSSEDDEEEEQVREPKPKQIKLDKQNGLENGKVETKEKQKLSKKEKKQLKQKQQQEAKPQKQASGGGEKTLQGGVKVEDIRVGNGPEAKSGKKVHVFYEGKLKANNKIFDSSKAPGPGFKFGLGRGEVIKGWDIGVAGMKVGGKRRITCPPQMAYGARGSPPVIPPNSTLVFEVELKSVN